MAGSPRILKSGRNMIFGVNYQDSILISFLTSKPIRDNVSLQHSLIDDH